MLRTMGMQHPLTFFTLEERSLVSLWFHATTNSQFNNLRSAFSDGKQLIDQTAKMLFGLGDLHVLSTSSSTIQEFGSQHHERKRGMLAVQIHILAVDLHDGSRA